MEGRIKQFMELDNYDVSILTKLEEDGRASFSVIAEELGISNTMVHKRFGKLVKNGALTKIEPVYDERILGYTYCAYTGITLEKEYETMDVIEQLKQIPEIVECHFITGPYSLYLKILCKDQDDFRRLLYEELEKVKGIAKSESFLDLGYAFRRNIMSGKVY